MTDRRRMRGVAILVALASIGAAIYFSPLGRSLDAAAIAARVRDAGGTWWAIPLFLLTYAILDLLFIPTQFLSIAAVLIWGWAWGATIELIAATVGAIPPYLLARSALGDWARRKLAAHENFAAKLDRDPFTVLLVLRVIPIVPYTPLNFVAGLSSIRLQPYALATLIGMVPSTYIFAFFVQAIIDGVMDPRDVAIRGLAAGALFAAMIIATRLAAPRLRRRLDAPPDRTSSPPASGDRD